MPCVVRRQNENRALGLYQRRRPAEAVLYPLEQECHDQGLPFCLARKQRADTVSCLFCLEDKKERPPPSFLAYYTSRYMQRDRALAEAYRTGAYSMQTIAEHFGVSRMAVGRAVNNNEEDTSVVPDVICETP
jgi:hypothetical protein